MSAKEFATLIDLIHRNLDLFATSLKDLVGTDIMYHYIYYHTIDTGTAEPVRKRPYEQSPEMMKEMKRQVLEMEEAGIVEESDSPWNSPCLLRRVVLTNTVL